MLAGQGGNKYVLMVIDNYFRFVKLYGLKHKTASSVCEKNKLGGPKIMLFDGG